MGVTSLCHMTFLHLTSVLTSDAEHHAERDGQGGREGSTGFGQVVLDTTSRRGTCLSGQFIVSWFCKVHLLWKVLCSVRLCSSLLLCSAMPRPTPCIAHVTPFRSTLHLLKLVKTAHLTLILNLLMVFTKSSPDHKTPLNSRCHFFDIQHGRPIQNSIILEILIFLNYSYFAKIMTRKPKMGNLTNMTELYPFLQ